MPTWISNQPTPPPPEITEPPSVPCELTPEMADFLAVPHPPTCVRRHLDYGLTSSQNEEVSPRAPGLHVSDLGYSKDGGLCPRQLWLRLHGDTQPKPIKPAEADYGRRLGWERGHVTEAWLAEMLEDTMPGWRIEGRNLPCNYIHASGHELIGELDILVREGTNDKRPSREVILDSKEVDDRKLATLDAPRPSNVCQVQGYLSAWRADLGMLVYMGRWSEPRAFYVPRDDLATHRRASEVISISLLPDAPKALLPKVTETENKGANSIKLELPWQCQWCPFLDHGCDGALPKTTRVKGVAGWRTSTGGVKLNRKKFDLAEDALFEEVEGLVGRLLEEAK